MYNKKESAVSPVVAVVLLLGIVGVIVAMAGVTVFSNIDNIMINEVKKVDVTVEISDDKISVTPAYNKNKDELLSYSVYLVMSDGNPVEPFTQNSDARLDINPKDYGVNIDDLAYINVIGHFNDNTDAIIFTGKIKDGYIVYTANPEPTPEQVTVTFITTDGKIVESDSQRYVVTLDEYGCLRDKIDSLPTVVTDNGKIFDYWGESEDTIFDNLDEVIPENIILTAYFKTKDKWTVTFKVDGTVYHTCVVDDGKRILDLPDEPSKENLYFNSWWYDDNNDGTPEKAWDVNRNVVKKDITLEAKWIEPYPYFRYGNNGYDHLSDLIRAINNWKPNTITYSGGYYSNWNYDKMTVTINQDIPLEDQSIFIKSKWELTINTAISKTTDYYEDGVSVYPADTNPHIWASPKWYKEETNLPLIEIENKGKIIVNNYLNIDGVNRMRNSLIKLDEGSSLNVNSELKVVNGNLKMISFDEYGVETISDNTVTLNGGGIYSEGKITTIDPGLISITNCKSYYGGGGIYVNKDDVNIKCDISWCESTFGGGFCAYQYEDLTVIIKDGSRFTNNHAVQYIKSGEADYEYGAQGGGIYMNSVESFTLGASSSGDQIIISGNTADSCGGGIHIAWTSPVIKGNVLVDDNKAFCKNGHKSETSDNVHYGGGGIYIEGNNDYYTLKVNNLLTVQNCKSEIHEDDNVDESISGVEKGNGGGIYNTGKIMVDSYDKLTVSGNTAANNGGGIYNDVTICYSSSGGGYIDVNDNNAKNGGGIYNKGEVSSYYSDIYVNNNIATENGGGIYNTNIIKQISSSDVLTVSGNKAPNGNGGGIYNAGGTITLKGNNNNNNINDNIATVNGGGIYNDGVIEITSGETKVNNNYAGYGGGIYNKNNINVINSYTLTVTGNGEDEDNNLITVNGGGIYNAGTVSSNNGGKINVNNNKAENGGGIYNTNKIEQKGTTDKLTVSGNTATNNGGGIHNAGGTITLKGNNNNINDNIATVYGGGIYNDGVIEITSGETKVNKNYAGYGGGIYNKKDIEVSACTLTVTKNGYYEDKNLITLNGGGINNAGTISLNNGGKINVNDNKAENGGGIYNGENAIITVITHSFITVNNNKANENGGGIYNDGVINSWKIMSYGISGKGNTKYQYNSNNYYNNNGIYFN